MWYVFLLQFCQLRQTDRSTDAYTFLGLGSKNEYQIQASLYNSGDFLGSKKPDSKGKASGYFYKKKDHGDWKSVEYE